MAWCDKVWFLRGLLFAVPFPALVVVFVVVVFFVLAALWFLFCFVLFLPCCFSFVPLLFAVAAVALSCGSVWRCLCFCCLLFILRFGLRFLFFASALCNIYGALSCGVLWCVCGLVE